jgi:3-(3-hydroxy-phenyl)propionate hydroxylase
MGASLRPVGRAFSERWLVVDAELRENVDLPDRLVHIADPNRPATYVPFAGRRRRWEFRLLRDEDPGGVTRPEGVVGLLRRHVDPGALDVRRAAVYSFVGAVARPWHNGRLLVAGDAAHVMPPFIGQGLCSGFRDAAFLGWALPAVVRDGAYPRLLDQYEAERAPHARAAVRLSVRAGRFIGAGPLAAAVRDASLALARRVPAVRDGLDDVRPRVPRFQAAIAGQAGAQLLALPQPWVMTPDGERLRLDDALGPDWSVIGIGLDPSTWVGDEPIWSVLRSRWVRIEPRMEEGSSGTAALREEGTELVRWAEARCETPVALVVRPDRFLFGAYGVDAGLSAARDLRKALGMSA